MTPRIPVSINEQGQLVYVTQHYRARTGQRFNPRRNPRVYPSTNVPGGIRRKREREAKQAFYLGVFNP